MPYCSTCLRKRKASTYASAQEKMLSAEHAARRRRGMKILAVGRDPTLLAEVCACLNPHAGRLSARSKPYEWKMLRRCLRCIPSPIRKNTSLICMRAARPFLRGRPTTPISATMCSMITTIWNVTTRCIILVLSLYWYILR